MTSNRSARTGRAGKQPSQTPARPGYDSRVVDVHRQSRIGLLIAAGFIGAAAVTAVVPHTSGAWLPLHLFLVGGVLTVISAVTQLLAVTWSASPAPPSALVRVQLAFLAMGAIAVAAGRERDVDAAAVGGAFAVIIALVLLCVILLWIRSAAGTSRFYPAIDGYVAAIAFSMVGVSLGIAAVVGGGQTWWSRVSQAHIDANLFGLIGLIIAATLPYFVATQARVKMSRRATPQRLRISILSLGTAVVVIECGRAFNEALIVGAGYCIYALGLVWMLTLLPRLRRRQFLWAGPRLVQLGAGVGWWIAMTVALAIETFADLGHRSETVRALIIGGYLQILVASLAYLGPVLRGAGHERLSAGFASTRSWIAVLAGTCAGAAAFAGHGPILTVALSMLVLDTAVRTVCLVRTATDSKPQPPDGRRDLLP